VARPRRCLTLSNPVPWQNWMAAYLGYTLRMRTLFRGWPIMVNDTHTRRRRLDNRLQLLCRVRSCYITDCTNWMNLFNTKRNADQFNVSVSRSPSNILQLLMKFISSCTCTLHHPPAASSGCRVRAMLSPACIKSTFAALVSVKSVLHWKQFKMLKDAPRYEYFTCDWLGLPRRQK